MNTKILNFIKKTKVIVIIRGILPERVAETVKLLTENSLGIIEFTFLHENKSDIIKNIEIIKIAKKAGPNAVIGAGTVLSKNEVDAAKKAGAEFIVMPDTNPEIIKYAKKKNLAVFPGAMTPTEVVKAYRAGADAVKIFPAEIAGLPFIKALQGPLGHIPLIAVGGIDEKNIFTFLSAGCIAAGVGGRLLNIKDEINKGNFSDAEKRIKSLSEALTNRG